MEAKFTKGPWSFSCEPQPNGCPIVGAGGLMVAMLAHTVNQPEQREEAIANARLIAAAPDLLEALKDAEEALAHMQDKLAVRVNPPTLEKLRAAIAKALGA